MYVTSAKYSSFEMMMKQFDLPIIVFLTLTVCFEQVSEAHLFLE